MHLYIRNYVVMYVIPHSYVYDYTCIHTRGLSWCVNCVFVVFVFMHVVMVCMNV
jgi:hypothetical protein